MDRALRNVDANLVTVQERVLQRAAPLQALQVSQRGGKRACFRRQLDATGGAVRFDAEQCDGALAVDTRGLEIPQQLRPRRRKLGRDGRRIRLHLWSINGRCERRRGKSLFLGELELQSLGASRGRAILKRYTEQCDCPDSGECKRAQ